MIRYLLAAVVAEWKRSRTLLLLSILGVALGVASVVTVQLINLSALAAFDGSLRSLTGDAELVILSPGNGLPESDLALALTTEGVADATPLVEVSVRYSEQPSRHVDVLGLDLLSGATIPLAPSNDDASEQIQAILTKGDVAASAGFLAEAGWQLGDSVTLGLGTSEYRVRVGAVIDPSGEGDQGASWLMMDIAHAQSRFDRRGRLDRIAVQLREGVATDVVASRLSDRLSDGARIETPGSMRNEARGMLRAFRVNLTALSLISVFVGVFLVYGTTRTALTRRRIEFGVLRSLGATRGQVLTLVLGEVAALGLLGVLLGIPLGLGAARANVDAVSGTLTDLYLLEAITEISLPTWIWWLAGSVGVGGALLGAAGPTWRTVSAPTRSLLSRLPERRSDKRVAAVMARVGLVVGALAVAWFFTIGRSWIHSGFAAALLLVVLIPLLAPWIVGAVTHRFHGRGFDWRFAVRGLERHLGSGGAAVAGLAVAVSMLVGITVMVASFRASLDSWIRSTVRADVYVSAIGWQGEVDAGGLPDGLVQDIEGIPGVSDLDRLRGFTGRAADRPVQMIGVDFQLAGRTDRFELLAGDLVQARGDVLTGDVLVSEPLARKAGLGLGSSLEIRTATGTEDVRVAGVYRDYSTELGAVTMDLATMERRFGPGDVHSIAVYGSGLDAAVLAREVRAVLAGAPATVRENRQLRENALRVFDQTFRITIILQAMALVIAAAGIALTLLVMAREQAGELGLYRALGSTRGQVFRFFVGKGLGMAALGILVGGVAGLVLAALLIYVTNPAYFGWTVQAQLPFAQLGLQALTILGAALITSLYPALGASRTRPEALSPTDA